MSKPATSIDKLLKRKYQLMGFKGEFKDLIGDPECAGSWIIYGDSGNGKTTFSLKLLKYIAGFRKCGYIPLEEGVKLTFQEAVERANLLKVAKQVKIWVDYTVEDLDRELSSPRSPDVIFIDSLQYLKMSNQSINELTKFEYKELLNRFPKKLFVFISHAKKNEPKGALAEAVFYGSDVCLHVKDFVVHPAKSRYKGKIPLELKEG